MGKMGCSAVILSTIFSILILFGIFQLAFYFSDYKDCANLLSKMSVCHDNEILSSEDYESALDYCMDNRHDAAFMRQARRYFQVDCGKFWYGLDPHPKD